MRRLIPFLPALIVGIAAILVLDNRGPRRSIAVVETPLAKLTLGPGQHLDFELAFRILNLPPQLDTCPTLFLHMLDPGGRLVRNFDHRISMWLGHAEVPGKQIIDRSTLVMSALDEPLPPGVYQLAAGLWEPKADLRLRIHREGQDSTRRLSVAEVEVTPAATAEPSPAFSSGWSAPEPADTVHGRSRRGWTKPATLTIGAHPTPLEWRLVIDMPPWATSQGELAIDCTGESVQLVERWQEIRFHIPAETPCRVSFPPIESTGETGGLLFSLSRSATPQAISAEAISAEAPKPACVRAL